MKSFAALALASSASAFTAPMAVRGTSSVTMETKADLESLAQELNPTIGFWDPIGLSDTTFWGESSDATIGFLRQAEIKHGRVAMAGFVGWCVQANGVRWPWPMSFGSDQFGVPGDAMVAFPEVASPPAQWDAIPEAAKWQIIWLVGFLEVWGESSYLLKKEGTAHYMRGGKPGYFPTFDELPHPVPFNLYDPFGLNSKKTDEQKARGLKIEINNGRLAMIGLFGFVAESKVPGSVPALGGLVESYAGDYMAPFESNFHIPGVLSACGKACAPVGFLGVQ